MASMACHRGSSEGSMNGRMVAAPPVAGNPELRLQRLSTGPGHRGGSTQAPPQGRRGTGAGPRRAGMVEVEVQAAALRAPAGALDDQAAHQRDVAQLDQVG